MHSCESCSSRIIDYNVVSVHPGSETLQELTIPNRVDEIFMHIIPGLIQERSLINVRTAVKHLSAHLFFR